MKKFKERLEEFARARFSDAENVADTSQSVDSAVQNMLLSREESHILSAVTFFSVMHSKWRMILLLTLLSGFLLAGFYYMKSIYTVSAVMSFNFEESSAGRNPNGTRFNISELHSLDVAKQAIEDAGLTGKITPEKLVDSISISPYTNTLGSGENGYYICSSYYLTFERPFSLTGRISARDMFDMIIAAYKNQFYDESIVTYRPVNKKDIDFDKLDYNEIGARFDMFAARSDRYLDMRISEAGAFFSKDGENFKSLKKLVTNLSEYDLKTYNSYVWENGIAKDKQERTDTLSYLNHRLLWKYTESMEENMARVSTLDEYDQSMTSSVLIPTYDDKYEFYMARTKTGVDTLARDADKKLSEAKSSQLSMRLNDDRIAKLGLETEQYKYENANKMIAEIKEKISDISDRISDIDNEYIRQKTRDYITIDGGRKSFFGRIHIKRVAALMLVVFVAAYTYYAVMRKRKNKEFIDNMLSSVGREGK